jgi:hypothetical protein
MHDATELVGHIPVFWARARIDVDAPLNILAVHLFGTAADIRSNGCPGHGAAGSRDISAPAVSDLMSENTAHDGPDNRSRNIGTVDSFFDDLPALDPTALFRWTYHGANRLHLRFVQPFAWRLR